MVHPSDDPDVISDPAALREHYGEPLGVAVAMSRGHLDAHHRRFIAHSPFVCIASASDDGFPCVSPRGDAPGFVHVRDDHTLVVPDRPGNNKVETYQHLLRNPRMGIIFFVPGVKETLRVQGTATLVLDDATRELGRKGEALPVASLVVKVARAYLHCGKSIVRSKLWDPSQHVAPGVIPSFGQMVKDQAGVDHTAEEMQQAIDASYVRALTDA